MLDPLTILSVAIGIGAAVVAVRAWSWRRVSKDSAFGSISERWLAEHRLNRPESER